MTTYSVQSGSLIMTASAPIGHAAALAMLDWNTASWAADPETLAQAAEDAGDTFGGAEW
jgi:hypothetical protein